MTDKLKPMSKEWFARQRRHRHNGFLGGAKMAAQNMRSILESDTATTDAKEIAQKIYNLTSSLSAALKNRSPGT